MIMMARCVRIMSHLVKDHSGLCRNLTKLSVCHFPQQSQYSAQASSRNDGHAEHWYNELVNPWKSVRDLTKHMEEKVLYEDGVKLSPNNVHAMGAMGPNLSMSDVIEAFNDVNENPLQVMFSQNRLHSGVTLYVKSKSALDQMKKYFRHVKANKILSNKYLVLLDGLVLKRDQSEIHVELRDIYNRKMSVVGMGKGSQARLKKRRNVFPLKHKVIEVKKLDTSSISLVELQAAAPKWDCIQLYFVDQRAPVVGDHQYSSRVRNLAGVRINMVPENCHPAPQTLGEDVKKALDLRDNDTSIVPLHIHCSNLRIPRIGAKKKEFIDICTPVPEYFKRTLQRLDMTSFK